MDSGQARKDRAESYNAEIRPLRTGKGTRGFAKALEAAEDFASSAQSGVQEDSFTAITRPKTAKDKRKRPLESEKDRNVDVNATDGHDEERGPGGRKRRKAAVDAKVKVTEGFAEEAAPIDKKRRKPEQGKPPSRRLRQTKTAPKAEPLAVDHQPESVPSCEPSKSIPKKRGKYAKRQCDKLVAESDMMVSGHASGTGTGAVPGFVETDEPHKEVNGLEQPDTRRKPAVRGARDNVSGKALDVNHEKKSANVHHEPTKSESKRSRTTKLSQGKNARSCIESTRGEIERGIHAAARMSLCIAEAVSEGIPLTARSTGREEIAVMEVKKGKKRRAERCAQLGATGLGSSPKRPPLIETDTNVSMRVPSPEKIAEQRPDMTKRSRAVKAAPNSSRHEQNEQRKMHVKPDRAASSCVAHGNDDRDVPKPHHDHRYDDQYITEAFTILEDAQSHEGLTMTMDRADQARGKAPAQEVVLKPPPEEEENRVDEVVAMIGEQNAPTAPEDIPPKRKTSAKAKSKEMQQRRKEDIDWLLVPQDRRPAPARPTARLTKRRNLSLGKDVDLDDLLSDIAAFASIPKGHIVSPSDIQLENEAQLKNTAAVKKRKVKGR